MTCLSVQKSPALKVITQAILEAVTDKMLHKKIASQMQLNLLLQKYNSWPNINDRLGTLTVPPPPLDTHQYAQLARDLETVLLPDLDRIGELELGLEQEEKMATRIEEQLAIFQENKKALDAHTRQLYRSKLHRSLCGPNLEGIATPLQQRTRRTSIWTWTISN
ncbi:hypothetical protein DFQ27_009423 [Actinomortierella ambigua]|uniref:Uncharacterized protein n=1 Tax=Actinomortierella ambigua TaxID=1343610 RepID=A0A9P6PP16_9FUNG|nr:hypothetical protein DFQ27_009423 [Actinomortierella ambigua]